MTLPKQSQPVMRQVSTAPIGRLGLAPSNTACTVCRVGCNLLPEPAKTVCNIACGALCN